ncbi:MAG: hypothetical protein WA030_00420 [Candidatus Microsaccharimonas sp.]
MIRLSNKKSPLLQKKWLIALILITCIVGIGTGVTFAIFHTGPTEESNQQQTENNDNTSGIKESQTTNGVTGSDLPNKSGVDNNSPNEDTDDNTDSTPPEQPNLLRADYTSSLKVVATFQQPSTGYCDLRVTKDDTVLTYKASIVIGSNYYSCSFDVAASNFPSKGEWSVVVIHTIGNLQTSSLSRIIEVT